MRQLAAKSSARGRPVPPALSPSALSQAPRASAAHQACRSIPASTCVAPFVYAGKSYKGCTSVDHKQSWCSLLEVYEPSWSNCEFECVEASCGWKPSSKCVTEFVYEEKRYSGCTTEGHHIPWCAHQRTYSPSWRPCGSNCGVSLLGLRAESGHRSASHLVANLRHLRSLVAQTQGAKAGLKACSRGRKDQSYPEFDDLFKSPHIFDRLEPEFAKAVEHALASGEQAPGISSASLVQQPEEASDKRFELEEPSPAPSNDLGSAANDAVEVVDLAPAPSNAPGPVPFNIEVPANAPAPVIVEAKEPDLASSKPPASPASGTPASATSKQPDKVVNVTLTMWIPLEYAKQFIGQDGANIKTIRDQTYGAMVRVGEQTVTSTAGQELSSARPLLPIFLSGTREAALQAHDLAMHILLGIDPSVSVVTAAYLPSSQASAFKTVLRDDQRCDSMDGWAAVATEKACREAATALGYSKAPDYGFVVRSSMNRSRGCYVHHEGHFTARVDFFWNEAVSEVGTQKLGVGTGENGTIQICQKSTADDVSKYKLVLRDAGFCEGMDGWRLITNKSECLQAAILHSHRWSNDASGFAIEDSANRTEGCYLYHDNHFSGNVRFTWNAAQSGIGTQKIGCGDAGRIQLCASDNSCTFVPRSQCVSSFTYKNKSYAGCTTVDSDAAWCSHDAVYIGFWSRCRNTCGAASCDSSSTTRVTLANVSATVSPIEEMPSGSETGYDCALVNGNFTGSITLTCNSGQLEANASRCVTDPCMGQKAEVVRAYAEVYRGLARLYNEYQDVVSSDASEVAIKQDYQSQKGVIVKEADKVSADLKDKAREMQDVLQRVNITRSTQGKLLMHIKRLTQECGELNAGKISKDNGTLRSEQDWSLKEAFKEAEREMAAPNSTNAANATATKIARNAGGQAMWILANVINWDTMYMKYQGDGSVFDGFAKSRECNRLGVTVKPDQLDKSVRLGLTTDSEGGPDFANNNFVGLYPGGRLEISGVGQVGSYSVADAIRVAASDGEMKVFKNGKSIYSFGPITQPTFCAHIFMREKAAAVEIMDLDSDSASVASAPINTKPSSTISNGTNATNATNGTVDACWWVPPAACAKRFEYQGGLYTGCTTVGSADKAWCAHDAVLLNRSEGNFSWCIRSCAPFGSGGWDVWMQQTQVTWLTTNITNWLGVFLKDSGKPTRYDAYAVTKLRNIESMTVKADQINKHIRFGFTCQDLDAPSFRWGRFVGFYKDARLAIKGGDANMSYRQDDEVRMAREPERVAVYKNEELIHVWNITERTNCSGMFAHIFIMEPSASLEVLDVTVYNGTSWAAKDEDSEDDDNDDMGMVRNMTEVREVNISYGNWTNMTKPANVSNATVDDAEKLVEDLQDSVDDLRKAVGDMLKSQNSTIVEEQQEVRRWWQTMVWWWSVSAILLVGIASLLFYLIFHKMSPDHTVMQGGHHPGAAAHDAS